MIEKPSVEVKNKSLETLKMLESKGEYLFHICTKKKEENFNSKPEGALFKTVDEALASMALQKEKYIYVFSKDNLTPVLYVKI